MSAQRGLLAACALDYEFPRDLFLCLFPIPKNVDVGAGRGRSVDICVANTKT